MLFRAALWIWIWTIGKRPCGLLVRRRLVPRQFSVFGLGCSLKLRKVRKMRLVVPNWSNWHWRSIQSEASLLSIVIPALTSKTTKAILRLCRRRISEFTTNIHYPITENFMFSPHSKGRGFQAPSERCPIRLDWTFKLSLLYPSQ